MKTFRVILLTDTAGILDREIQLFRELTIQEVEILLKMKPSQLELSERSHILGVSYVYITEG